MQKHRTVVIVNYDNNPNKSLYFLQNLVSRCLINVLSQFNNLTRGCYFSPRTVHKCTIRIRQRQMRRCNKK